MRSDEVVLEHEWVGKSLLKAVLRLGGKILYVDRINPSSAQARAKFLKAAKQKEPHLNDEVLDAVLMDLAEQGPEEQGDGLPGSPLTIESPLPSTEPVEGSQLLGDIRDLLNRFVVLPDHAAEAVSLWILFSYCTDAFDVSPRLLITSPQHRCGKTRLLRLLSGLCCKSVSLESITPSALFRTIEIAQPTVLIDEGDAFLKGEDFRGLLNAGHLKGGRVIRAVGSDNEPRSFNVFCPLAVSMIGKPPTTVVDRSVVIEMKRKNTEVRVPRIRRDQLNARLDQLRRKCARWAEDHFTDLMNSQPPLPGGLNDRAQDNWEPLLAIANAVGGQWPRLAREAAVGLSLDADDEEVVTKVLIEDIRKVFEEAGVDRMSSADLVARLRALERRPWPRQDLTPISLARLLRPLGVSPRTIRLQDGRTPKGYLREMFVVGEPESNRHTATRRRSPEVAPDPRRHIGTRRVDRKAM